MGFGRPRGGATPEALEHLYRTQFSAFLRVAASIAGERHAADAVHNASVRVLRHRESFREGRSLEAWVWRTVVNAARDVQTSPPYAARQLAGRELAQANGALQYYDPRTDTIHTTPPNAVPDSPTAFAVDEGLRERMLHLLHSGEAREDGRLVVGGRDAIRIVSSDGNMTLIVDAATYEPIEWSWVSDEGVSETSRLDTYEWLPATKRNLALLSLTAQHPNARIRQDAAVTGTDGEGK